MLEIDMPVSGITIYDFFLVIKSAVFATLYKLQSVSCVHLCCINLYKWRAIILISICAVLSHKKFLPSYVFGKSKLKYTYKNKNYLKLSKTVRHFRIEIVISCMLLKNNTCLVNSNIIIVL